MTSKYSYFGNLGLVWITVINTLDGIVVVVLLFSLTQKRILYIQLVFFVSIVIYILKFINCH